MVSVNTHVSETQHTQLRTLSLLTNSIYCAHLSVSDCLFAVQDKAVTLRRYRHTAECLSDCDAVQNVTRDVARFGAYCFLHYQGRTVSFPEVGAGSLLGDITKCHFLSAGQEMVPVFSLQLVLATSEAPTSAHCTSASLWSH